MSIPRNIFAIEVDLDGKVGNLYSFPENLILFITTWKPKSNYQIPLIYTRIGIFTVVTTLEECIGIPNFVKIQNSLIINPDHVANILENQTGAQIKFKNGAPDISISDYKWRGFDWSLVLNKVSQTPDWFIPAVTLDKRDKATGVCFVELKDIFSVEDIILKSNYYVPKFSGIMSNYSIATTLQAFRILFPNLVSMGKDSLVNLDEVERAQKLPYDIIVYFKNSKHTTSMAKNKEKYFKFLFK